MRDKSRFVFMHLSWIVFCPPALPDFVNFLRQNTLKRDILQKTSRIILWSAAQVTLLFILSFYIICDWWHEQAFVCLHAGEDVWCFWINQLQSFFHNRLICLHHRRVRACYYNYMLLIACWADVWVLQEM